MRIPSVEERLAQLNRLERWCRESPRWKVEGASALLGCSIAVLSVMPVVLTPLRDTACVYAGGGVVCFDLRTGEVLK